MSADAKDQTPLDLISRLLAAVPLPAFVVDEQHRIHYLNREARQRAPEESGAGDGGSPCYSRIFGREAPCDLCVMKEALADGADEVLCSQLIGGQQVRATGMRFTGEDGAAYVVEIVHMGGEGLVSSRASTDLREDAMHSVVDSSNEVVLLFDGQYRAVIANRVAQQTLGYTAAEFAERTLVDLGVAKSTEELGRLLTRADGGVPATARAVIQSASGGKMPVKVSLSLLVGSSTRVVGACTFAAPRYSSAALPAMGRTASGPLPKPGMGPASGPLPRTSMGPPSGPISKPKMPSRPATPAKPKPPAKPKSPSATAGAKEAGSDGAGGVSESLEVLAGNLESESTVVKKAEQEKRKRLPKAPPPPTPDQVAVEVEELDAALLEVEEQQAPPTPPKPPAPPREPSKPSPKAAPKGPPSSPPREPSKPSPKAAPKEPPSAPSKAAPKDPPPAPPKAPEKPAAAPAPAAAKPSPSVQEPLKEVTVQVVAEPSVVASASDGIEALLGYPSTEVVTWTAQDWFTRVHEPQLATDLENMWSGLVGQVFEPGALPDQNMEYPLIRKDGSVVACATTWRAVQAADGKFEGLEVVIKPKPE